MRALLQSAFLLNYAAIASILSLSASFFGILWHTLVKMQKAVLGRHVVDLPLLLPLAYRGLAYYLGSCFRIGHVVVPGLQGVLWFAPIGLVDSVEHNCGCFTHLLVRTQFACPRQ